MLNACRMHAHNARHVVLMGPVALAVVCSPPSPPLMHVHMHNPMAQRYSPVAPFCGFVSHHGNGMHGMNGMHGGGMAGRTPARHNAALARYQLEVGGGSARRR